MATAYIALGANLGDRAKSLRTACKRMVNLGTVTNRSSIYETDPVGYLDQPPFLNAVIELETSLGPDELLTELQKIELALGRERSFRNAPRTIDLDLVMYENEVIESEMLTLPHPRTLERAFVLIPLAEIAPGVIVPGLDRTVHDLVNDLPHSEGVRKWGTF